MYRDSNGRSADDVARFQYAQRTLQETGQKRIDMHSGQPGVVRLDDLRPEEVVTIPGMPDALRWSLAVDRNPTGETQRTDDKGRTPSGRLVLHAAPGEGRHLRAADLVLREDIAATMYGWVIPPEPVRRALGDLAPGAAFQYEPDGPTWERSRDPEPFHQVRVIRRDDEGRVIDTGVQHEDTDVLPVEA